MINLNQDITISDIYLGERINLLGLTLYCKYIYQIQNTDCIILKPKQVPCHDFITKFLTPQQT